MFLLCQYALLPDDAKISLKVLVYHYGVRTFLYGVFAYRLHFTRGGAFYYRVRFSIIYNC